MYTQPLANFQGMNREDIIQPFTLGSRLTPGSSSANLADRKRADGGIIPVYDHFNSLPSSPTRQSEADDPDDADGQLSRPRFNPPAYSPYPGASGELGAAPRGPGRKAHSKKGSQETAMYSINSSAAMPPPPVRGDEAGTNVSGLEDAIDHMGFQATETGNGTAGTLVNAQAPRRHVFRPVIGNPDEPPSSPM